jgi:signal transduction histidine kinase
MSNKLIRRLTPQKVRTRLTLLYALMFLAAGSSLLAVTYALLADRLPAPSNAALKASSNPRLLVLCKQQPPSSTVLAQCKQAFAAGARAATRNQRDQTLNSLLVASLIGLGATTVVSAGLGWILSGRALRPIRAMTDTAKRASAEHLGERLALAGPRDELKELADTFDEMLERLDRAFASQQRFVANAAHELRTPLTAMRTSIEVTLSKPTRTPEQLEAMAARIRRGIQRAEATVEALLALATSEQDPATNESVDLATATEDAIDTAAPTIAELNLKVDATLNTAPITGDPALLERMIANLVENAVRHNLPGGWISVQTATSNGHALFQIANSGPQVPEDSVPALFEPFQRAEERLNPTRGIGLGLSIAQAISQAHGATITAHSRPEGGLDVAVRLPHSDRHPSSG